MLEQFGEKIAVDPAGNLVLGGTFSGAIDFGGGPLGSPQQSLFVAKVDPSGQHIWSVKFDTAAATVGGMAVDTSGSIVLAGSFHGTIDFGGGPLVSAGAADVFVVKLDPSGNHVFSGRYGDANAQDAYGLALDAQGNAVIMGKMSGAVDFGGGALNAMGGGDVFIVKLNAAGGHVFSRTYGDGAFQAGSGVAVSSTGLMLTVGGFEGTLDLGGNELGSDGGVDLFAMELGPQGEHVWSTRGGDLGFATMLPLVTIDTSDDAVIGASFAGALDLGGGSMQSLGSTDVLLAKMDISGGALWSARFGDAETQRATDVTADAFRNIVVVGDFDGGVDFGGGSLISAGGRDVFLAKMNPLGEHVCSKRFGDADVQHVSGVAADSAGNISVIGYFRGSVDFGDGALVSESGNGNDMFVARFEP